MEEWRRLEEFPYYEVSDFGRVRSIDRDDVPHKEGFFKTVRGKILSPCLSQGYPAVCILSESGKRKMRRIHVLVATAFLGPRPEGAYVCHTDDDRLNPKLDNLKYATPRENQFDRLKTGRTCRGEDHANSRLKKVQIDEILNRLAHGELQRNLAAEYGVTQSQISHIKTGRSWGSNYGSN